MSEQASGAEMAQEIPEEAVAQGAQMEAEAGPPPEEKESSPQEAPQAEFDELSGDGEMLSPEHGLDVILNIPVTLSMEVGRTRMTIRELMELKRGSVVKFDRLAGEPMDVLVNGTLVAHGEVVVVNDRFGIRLIDVISPEERVRKLR